LKRAFAKIVGTDKNKILAALHQALESEDKLPSVSPFGDDTAAEKPVDVIRKGYA